MQQCMETKIAELRKRIERTKRNRRGHKIFAVELRDQVVELAHAWMADGRRRSELARRLGLDAATLSYWLHQCGPAAAPDEARVRPVQVFDIPASDARTGERSIVLPSGIRIEGLTLGDVVELARALA